MGLPETGVRLVAEDASSFISKMGRADDAVDRFGRSSGGASVGVVALGTSLGNLATGALGKVVDLMGRGAEKVGGFLVGSVGLAADLEAQMDGVGAVMQATNEEIEKLNDLVIDLGIDPNLKVSSIEAAEAVEMLARNGLSMENILDGAARATVFLANATGADFALSADVATDAMALFNIEADDMLQVVDGVSGVASNSKFTVQDYALALRNGGAAAADMNISLQDFNTTIAASAEELGSGMRAGTAFRNFITRLTPSTKVATAAMTELGLITEDGANQFFDANGQMKDMNEVAIILNDAMEGLTDAQRSAALETIFGADALGTALALGKEGDVVYTDLAKASEELGIEQDILNKYIDDGITGFEILSAKMDKVDSEEAAATRVNNLSGALDILSGVQEAVSLKIGTALIPALTTFARVATDFLDQNSDRLIGFFETLGATLSTFATGFSEAFAGGGSLFESFLAGLASAGVPEETIGSIQSFVDTVVRIGNFLVTWGPTIIKTLGLIVAGISAFSIVSSIVGFISSLVTAWGMLSAAFSAGVPILTAVVGFLGGPITLAIGAVILAVGALYWAWQNNFLGIQEIVASIMPQVQAFITNSMTVIRGAVMFVLGEIQAFWANHGDSVMVIVQGLWSLLQSAFEIGRAYVTTTLNNLVTNATVLWDTFGADLIAIATTYLGAIEPLWENLKIAIGAIVDGIAAVISGDWKGFGENLVKLSTAMFDSMIIVFETSLAAIGQAIQAIIREILNMWNNTDWEALGQAVIDALVGTIKKGASAVRDAARKVAESVGEAISGALGISSPSKLMIDIANNVINTFRSQILAGRATLEEAIGSTFDFADKLGALGSSAVGIFKRHIGEPLKKQIDGLQKNADTLQGRLAAALGVDTLSHQDTINAFLFGEGQTKREAQALLDIQSELGRKKREQADAEEKILELQRQQQDLNFLKQQVDLLNFVKENELGADVLQGLTLGASADPLDIISATSRAFEAIIEQTAGAIGVPASASQIAQQSVNNDNSRRITVNGRFLGQEPQTLAGELEQVLANYG